MKILICLNLIIVVESVKKSTRYNISQSNDQQTVCYIKEVLANKSHNPNQLAVDRKNNILFYSLDTGEGQFVPALLDINTKRVKILKGVKDTFALAIDDKSAYFGGSQGIYKYHLREKKLFLLGVSNLDVWWLFVKKNVYFVQFPSLNAYVYKDRTIKSVTQLKKTIVHQFVFDSDDNLYFVNGSGLFGVKTGSSEHVLLRDKPAFFGLAVDNADRVYVSSDDGIYVLSKTTRRVKQIVRVSNAQAIAFDKNNHLIYSDSSELVRLLAVTTADYKYMYKSGQSGNDDFCE